MSDHDLGKAELEFIASLVTPLVWIIRRNDGLEMMKSGTAFFLNTGKGLFGVTAAHVTDECLQDASSPNFVASTLAANDGLPPLLIDLKERIIASHSGIDIATFKVTADEVSRLRRQSVSGFQRSWPPPPAKVDHGVTMCGFPGEARRWVAQREISFGMIAVACVITNSNSTSLSLQLERDRLLRILGNRNLPETYDFGGISGAPVLAIVERGGLRGWTPVGVIFEGPNPSANPDQAIAGLEIIRARPTSYINVDGTLDVPRWENENWRP
jgi:hypothetical protein